VLSLAEAVAGALLWKRERRQRRRAEQAARDSRERSVEIQRLAREAAVDPLTALANRRAAAIPIERIRRGVEAAPITLGDGSSFTVTATFGVAQHLAGIREEDLLAAADQALYAAKRGGRNRAGRGGGAQNRRFDADRLVPGSGLVCIQ
jgi:GGDEF domain-containing protein